MFVAYDQFWQTKDAYKNFAAEKNLKNVKDVTKILKKNCRNVLHRRETLEKNFKRLKT